MEKAESSHPEIEGTKVFQARSGDMIRVITSQKAQEELAEKGIELGATYKLFGPENPTITIAGISDGQFGFKPEDTQERVKSLRSNRASLWVYLGDEKTIGYYGYLSDFTKKDDMNIPGFNMKFNGKVFRHDKIEDRETPDVIDTTSGKAMNLL